MIAPQMRSTIIDAIWRPGLTARTEVWAILDAARDARIYGAVHATFEEKACLFSGALPWQLQMAAPYLVRLAKGDQLTRQVIDQGWGNAWGIFLRTETSPRSLRKHLRGFLRVRDRSGRHMMFRYYDPRVFRIYLPTCELPELRTVYGPVTEYVMEGAEPDTLLEFRFDGVQLTEHRLTLTAGATAGRG